MKHRFLIISLLSFIPIITSDIPVLDISDYTFYYTTYHYLLPSLTTNTTTFYNAQLSTNITITFADNITLILNNKTKLNLLNDNQWNEISIISQANTHTNKRRLRTIQTEYAEEKQYEGVPHGKNWESAQKYCKSTRRGHLATILDETDNFAVATECSALGTRWHCWLGLKRPFETWIDGEAVEFTNWLPGEPNNWGGDENCVEIYGSDEQIGFEEMWNDLNCAMMRGFVCERPPRSAPPPKPRKLICDCDNVNLQGDDFLRRRLGRHKKGRHKKLTRRSVGRCAGCNKKLTRKQIRKRKKQRAKWARIRAYSRARRRKRARRRAAVRLARKRARRRRKKWRAHLRRLRRKHREGMKREYAQEMRLEKRRNAGYNLLNKLIGSALGGKHAEGARFGQVGELRRRRLGVGGHRHDYDGYVYGDYGYEMISRCKVIVGDRNYEICVNYNFGDMFLSVDVRFVDRKVLRNGNGVNFRTHSDDLSVGAGAFGGYHVVERGEMFDPIEGNLGYAVWKYELMDWHGFNGEDGDGKYAYGEFREFDDYIHYFEEHELYFNNMVNVNGSVAENVCSGKIGNLPFKMCMKAVGEDTMLYFEKDGDDGYLVDATYSFQAKEFIDNGFENNVFYFNEDGYWDEISVVNVDKDMQWMKKCSFKLLIAKICIEQFHINDSRASIKFQSKNTYNSSV